MKPADELAMRSRPLLPATGMMLMGDREMTGFIAVKPEALGPDTIAGWIAFANSFVRGLPAR